MIIYRIYNKINGKSYIGQSINKFNIRYKGGKWWKYNCNQILKSSILKYGLENFDIEILEENICNIDNLNFLEFFYADKFNSYRPYGYNIRGCGDNKFVDNKLKKHLSTFRMGKNYIPLNKKSSTYKGVSWRESKKSWMCRFNNHIINKTKYVNSEIEAAETFDKISLYLIGNDCFINFEEKRNEYLSSDLPSFYRNFISIKRKRKNGYFKDDSILLESIKPLIWEMSIPKISEKLNISKRRIQWCIKKHNLEAPNKNYWQKIKTKNKND